MSALPLSPLAKARPILAAVAQPPKRASLLVFTAVVAIFSILGMVGVLFVTTRIQVQSRQVQTLRQEAQLLHFENSQLEAQLQRLRAPEALAARAAELGMRSNPNPAYIDLSSRKIVGTAAKVTGNELDPALYDVDPKNLDPLLLAIQNGGR